MFLIVGVSCRFVLFLVVRFGMIAFEEEVLVADDLHRQPPGEFPLDDDVLLYEEVQPLPDGVDAAAEPVGKLRYLYDTLSLVDRELHALPLVLVRAVCRPAVQV